MRVQETQITDGPSHKDLMFALHDDRTRNRRSPTFYAGRSEYSFDVVGMCAKDASGVNWIIFVYWGFADKHKGEYPHPSTTSSTVDSIVSELHYRTDTRKGVLKQVVHSVGDTIELVPME